MSGLNERSKRQIALLAGDDLEGEAHDEALRSVQSCPDCRQHWVRVCGCLSLLDRVGRDAAAIPERSLWPEVQRRLRSVTAARGPEKFNGWIPALSMAAACIALLIAGQMDGPPPQDAVEVGGDALHGAVFPAPQPPVRPGIDGPWNQGETPQDDSALLRRFMEQQRAELLRSFDFGASGWAGR